MEKSIAEGSQTFEENFAQLINEGVITREEGLAFADSPTNLLWRLQNSAAGDRPPPPAARKNAPATMPPSPKSRSTFAPPLETSGLY